MLRAGSEDPVTGKVIKKRPETDMPLPLILFIICHWYLAAFCQTVFLHRYASHQMFTMPKFWERVFYAATFLTQGSSYLNPRSYALMHRMHHAYSDTTADPHSPQFFKNPVSMMKNTLLVYLGIYVGKMKVEENFEGGYPVWPAFDRWLDGPLVRLLWIGFYLVFYRYFTTAWWQYLFIPLHVFMGPIHGAIVNWCGHKYGYSNFDNHDRSKNTFFADFLTMGELMQNNHHHKTQKPNFASRWFELDPTYPLLSCLNLLKIIRFQPAKKEEA